MSGERIVLVTGASRGLGKAIADRFELVGDTVLRGSRLTGVDVRYVGVINAWVQEVLQGFGRIDVLVCAAGCHGFIGPVRAIDVENWDDWKNAIEVNLYGTVQAAHAVLPTMLDQGRGTIIAVSGGGAANARPNFSAYACSKAAIVRFVETLAEEVKGTGITVNAIAPGPLDTALFREVVESGMEVVPAATVPLEYPAELAFFLASDRCAGITGRMISANWDDWGALPDMDLAPDWGTLRRVT